MASIEERISMIELKNALGLSSLIVSDDDQKINEL